MMICDLLPFFVLILTTTGKVVCDNELVPSVAIMYQSEMQMVRFIVKGTFV